MPNMADITITPLPLAVRTLPSFIMGDSDAVHFERRVQKKRYTSEKMPSQCPQNGRSMIEMLGVLAIIGVLSVGGIMGYSKAMFRYKINKTIEQITYIAGNVRTTFASQGNYQGVGDVNIWKKAHIFPDDMWKEDWPWHAWDGDVNIEAYNPYKAFRIVYNSVPENACIELVTHNWNDANITLLYIDSEIAGNWIYMYPPLTLDDAVKVCTNSNDSVEIGFYADIDKSYYQSYVDESIEILSGL